MKNELQQMNPRLHTANTLTEQLGACTHKDIILTYRKLAEDFADKLGTPRRVNKHGYTRLVYQSLFLAAIPKDTRSPWPCLLRDLRP